MSELLKGTAAFALILMGLIVWLGGGANWDKGRRGAAITDIVAALFLVASGFWLAVHP